MHVCVCVCVRARARVCVRVCVCEQPGSASWEAQSSLLLCILCPAAPPAPAQRDSARPESMVRATGLTSRPLSLRTPQPLLSEGGLAWEVLQQGGGAFHAGGGAGGILSTPLSGTGGSCPFLDQPHLAGLDM